MRCLVVDDDEANRKVLAAFLAPYGKCDLADGGEMAIDLFKKSIEESVFYDLVCLDIMMPGRDGVTTLREMRQAEDLADVSAAERAKILMVTAVVDKKIVMEAFKIGCQGYVIKPLERDEIIRQLRNLKLVAGI